MINFDSKMIDVRFGMFVMPYPLLLSKQLW